MARSRAGTWFAAAGGLAVIVGIAALTSCGGAADPVAAPWPSARERTLREGHAPTPYTADQIRAACPDGRKSTYRMEGGGTQPLLQRFTFREGDAEGTRVWLTIVDPAGKPVRVPAGRRDTWQALQGHASYPAEHTTISDVTIEVPAGRFDCMLYTVKTVEGGVEKVTNAWFAREIPGPPVRMEEWWDASLQESMILVKHEMPARTGAP